MAIRNVNITAKTIKSDSIEVFKITNKFKDAKRPFRTNC